jgi:hypothetical protein
MRKTRTSIGLCILAAVMVGLSFGATLKSRDNANSRVIPVTSSAYRQTYAEWSAAHWQWLYSLPVDEHPLFETADVSQGQSGKVWFLGGTFSSTEVDGVVVGQANREARIPSGTPLFFPIMDVEAATLEGNGETEAELAALASAFADLIVPESLFLYIDGQPVTNLAEYRVRSPLFEYGPLPENNVLAGPPYYAPAGATSPAVSDGYFVMLKPLPVGTHTLYFGGLLDASEFGFQFALDITYEITVVPAGQYP